MDPSEESIYFQLNRLWSSQAGLSKPFIIFTCSYLPTHFPPFRPLNLSWQFSSTFSLRKRFKRPPWRIAAQSQKKPCLTSICQPLSPDSWGPFKWSLFKLVTGLLGRALESFCFDIRQTGKKKDVSTCSVSSFKPSIFYSYRLYLISHNLLTASTLMRTMTCFTEILEEAIRNTEKKHWLKQCKKGLLKMYAVWFRSTFIKSLDKVSTKLLV